jgi:hypothetical protein
MFAATTSLHNGRRSTNIVQVIINNNRHLKMCTRINTINTTNSNCSFRNNNKSLHPDRHVSLTITELIQQAVLSITTTKFSSRLPPRNVAIDNVLEPIVLSQQRQNDSSNITIKKTSASQIRVVRIEHPARIASTHCAAVTGFRIAVSRLMACLPWTCTSG